MMNVQHQLPAPVAFCIIAIIALATGTLLMRAINSVDFSSVNTTAASVSY